MMELLARKLAVAALIGSLILPSAGVIAADNNGNSAVSVTADKLEYNGKTRSPRLRATSHRPRSGDDDRE